MAVVTDSGVPAQYAQMVADQCKDAAIITVPQGEASKSFKILETVLRQMLDFGMGRGDLVVAVGGGVVGDLAGFAASIYMRGIDFIDVYKRQEEGPPDIVDTAGLCQQPRCRQQHEQLAADRNDEAEDAVAQRLKDRAEHDADARQQEMQADDAHGRDADSQHGVAGGKDAQHLPGCELEDAEACQHDALGVAHRQLDGLFHTVRSAGTIVVADDGHHAVVQAKNGHEHEALQLEVDAEHRHRCRGEGHQDQVHAKGHQAAHALHGDAGQTHGVDAVSYTHLPW